MRARAADVEAVDRVDVQAIEKRRRRRDARLLVAERADPAVHEGGRRTACRGRGSPRAEHHRHRRGSIEVVDAQPRSSTTISVCIQTSPSGCHSGSCGQSTSAAAPATAARRCRGPRERQADRRPRRRAAAASRSRPRCARRADRRAGSGGRSRSRRLERELEAGGELHGAQDAQAVVAEGGRDRRRAARGGRGRRGRRTDRSISSRSGSQAMALMVKSRRRGPPRIDMYGSPTTSKPLWPRPVFDSRRGSETSRPATL